MKNNITELVCILDRSGSMSGLESDTIGGFNSLINKQKKEDGMCYVSTVLFNSESTVIHDRVPIEKIEPMTADDYVPGGNTALLDAIGSGFQSGLQFIQVWERRESQLALLSCEKIMLIEAVAVGAVGKGDVHHLRVFHCLLDAVGNLMVVILCLHNGDRVIGAGIEDIVCFLRVFARDDIATEIDFAIREPNRRLHGDLVAPALVD